MPLRGLRRLDSLAGRPPRRRSRRMRIAAVVSLLIHLVIAVLLLVTIPRGHKEEVLPPPAPVTMVFNTGRREGPTLPNPSLVTSPGKAPPTPPVEATPLPTPPVPPTPPLPEAPTPTAPPPVQPPAAAKPPPAPSQPPPPAPSPPPPPPDAEPAPSPPPPPPKPRPVPPPPKPAPPKPAPPPRPEKREAPLDFPAPMNFSFGNQLRAPKALPRQAARPHIPGTIDMSMGPATRGAANPTPYSDNDDTAAGTDWRNALSRWVAEHAYYPEQARRFGEEGDAMVHVIAKSDGTVKEVELVRKSGSMWLDIALVALFRDAHIPPFPAGGDEPLEFNFLMHYMLIRQEQ